jgi:hypothetical protein
MGYSPSPVYIFRNWHNMYKYVKTLHEKETVHSICRSTAWRFHYCTWRYINTIIFALYWNCGKKCQLCWMYSSMQTTERYFHLCWRYWILLWIESVLMFHNNASAITDKLQSTGTICSFKFIFHSIVSTHHFHAKLTKQTSSCGPLEHLGYMKWNKFAISASLVLSNPQLCIHSSTHPHTHTEMAEDSLCRGTY